MESTPSKKSSKMEAKVKSKRMSSSRKHKKHKEKKQSQHSVDSEANSSEQKPLRLVLKVPTPYSTQSSPNAANTSQSAPTLAIEPPLEAGESESPPKLMAFSGLSPQTSQTSSKKVKKKKSKKKHRKHSHHSGHHSRHRHRSHHRRHHGSCSHHSRLSQDSNSASLSGAVPVPQKSPQKSLSSSKSSTKSQFQYFLCHLLKQLQRKDIQQFFAWPVSDMIAPGYSSIIVQPMDLSSMKRKIDQNEYESISEFKSDVKLICDNCQKYNRPETVYYKAATKLWHYTRNKLLNRDALLEVVRSYPGLSSYELGFHFEETNASANIEMDVNHSKAPDLANTVPMTIGETLPPIEERQELQEVEAMDEDGMTPEQILEEAKKAAQMAADRLTLERPNGAHFSFLRQRGDGSTTLSIVGNHSYEQNINLEALVGKLVEGTAALAPFKEIESNRIRPIESINESPFCSYLPSLDSSKATLNEEDSALLLSTYGDDELGQQYAQSITQFSYETDYVLNLVDSLLDILTHGQHQKIAVKLREKQKTSEMQTLIASNDSNVETNNNEIQGRLNETGSLIGQIESLQYQRLSSSTLPIKPSTEEEKLANQLSSKLTDIIGSHSAPKDVSDITSVRKAMGIKIKTEK